MNANLEQVKAIFLEAVEKAAPEERDAYLQEACRGNEELYQQVEVLLQAHESASLLDKGAIAPSPTIDQPITEQPGDIIGPYKLLQQIGEGGMGVVYMAEQSEPVERRVALKVIKPGMDTRKVIARFKAERQALAMMDHPNIAKVLDAGTTDSGRPYFVMELVKGAPVTKYCDDKQLTPRGRLELFVPICQAVQHAHQKGIIHRDIKPSNVLVAQYDDRPVPKIIDFGVAKAIEQRLTEKTMFTEFGQVVGTVEYMSPEQTELNQLDVDTRSDVYSLGVLLYELLTGETPFDREQLRSAAFDEMLRIIREEEPPRPSLKLSTSESLPSIAANRHVDPKQLSATVHGELDWIVMKALEKDRSRRYETASKFAEDVQHYLSDEAVTACPPSTSYRLRKFARKNKAEIATASAIAVALVIGTGVATWQAIRATQERDRATNERNRALAAEVKAVEEAERADREAENAETEAAVSKAVNDFLRKDLLGMTAAEAQVKAGLTPDPHIELRTLLDRATMTIEDRFNGQPLVEAAIRKTLGDAYLSIGEYGEAEEHQSRAINISRSELGEEHASTLESMIRLAVVYEQQCRFDEAEELQVQNLETIRRVLGEEHPNTLWSMNNLGVVYEKQGRFKEAEEFHRQTLEIRRRTLGDDHPDTLASVNNLGVVYEKQGRFKEAEELHRKTLQSLRSRIGEDHPQTLLSMMNVGSALNSQRRYDEAESQYWQTLQAQRRVLGDDHPSTLATAGNLANVYADQGRSDEAESLYSQTLAICQRVLGDGHSNTLHCMGNLGNLYQKQERYDEAEAINRKVLEIRRRILGQNHPDTASTMTNLGLVLLKLGRVREAENLLRQSLSAFSQTLGSRRKATVISALNLVTAISSTENDDSILKILEDVVAGLRETDSSSPDSTWTKDYSKKLSGNLSAAGWRLSNNAENGQRDIQLALRLTRLAMELGSDSANNWDNLGVVLYRNGQFDEAIEALEEAREMRNGKDRYHQIFLAMAYWQVGRYEEAVANYLQVAKWLASGPRAVEQYRFRDEAEALLESGTPNGIELVLERLTEEIEQAPDSIALHTMRGSLYRKQQAWEKSAADWARAIELSADGPGFNSPRKRRCRKIAEWLELFDRVAQLLPEDQAVWIGRGQYDALRSQWDDARAAYQHAHPLQPVGDAATEYAGVLLICEAEEEYRRFCTQLTSRSAESPDASSAYQLARSCALGRDSDVEKSRVIEWAEQGVTESNNAWELHVLGLAQYRAGRLDEAIRSLAASNAGNWPTLAKTQNDLVLAMAHQQLGDEAKAQHYLQQATTTIDQSRPPQTGDPVDIPIPDWIEIEVLRREAEKLIKLPKNTAREPEQSESNELNDD